ncbi:uncharacterized protein G2W53_043203 [Senna tora]|uniref:Uncharacterized protein n=1 Tax=Senna tora TaxID=362788 RepID=A0A834SNL5_9FABA|nr:uncharacterized protein G2W53_043203 [Senna tora]
MDYSLKSATPTPPIGGLQPSFKPTL